MSNFTLEKSKHFPLMAWTLSVGFAIFVGYLALQLNDFTVDLAVRNVHLETNIHNNSTSLDNLAE